MAAEGSAAETNKGWLYHPDYPEHWTRRPLYSLARWVNGLAFKNIQFSRLGMPIIKIAEIKNGISGQTKFTEQTFDDSVHVRAGDLLFSWSGQPETSIDAFWWHGPEGWLNQHIFRVTPDDGIDPTFFFYLLRYLKPNFVGIARNKQTTGLGHVTKHDLENIEGAYPGGSEQHAIAHILGTLDDKIELNRRMSETLEAMARALFKSWFVDFDPVRAKMEGRWKRGQSLPGLPAHLYGLFPDRLVSSELGDIPEGWEVKTLSEVCEKPQYGYTASASEEEVGPKFLRITDINKRDWIEWKNVPYCAIDESLIDKYALAPGDLVIARMADPGHGALIEEQVDAVFASYLIRFRPRKRELARYLQFWLRSDAYWEQVRARQSGTTRANLNAKVLGGIPLLLPPSSVLVRYETLVSALRIKVVANVSESRVLTTVRDVLLPKLVSGELRLK